jgi:hypothetical protein
MTDSLIIVPTGGLDTQSASQHGAARRISHMFSGIHQVEQHQSDHIKS